MLTLKSLMRAGAQSASIMTVADIATQMVIEGRTLRSSAPVTANAPRHLYDPSHTLWWTLAGVSLHGPYFFAMFSRLDAYLGPATSFKVVVKKTALAQFVAFPPYLIALFTLMGYAEGCDDIPSKLRERFPEAFLGGCAFWPLANAVNFAFVPGKMRVLYLAGVGSIWNCFLSCINAKGKEENGTTGSNPG